MNTFRLTVQYTTHIDIEVESLDDPEVDARIDTASYFENYVNELLMPDGYVACDSAVWIEPVDAYIPVRISKERADKLIALLPTDIDIEEEHRDHWDYETLKDLGYVIEGIEK